MRPKGRPKKPRRIETEPKILTFSPRGKPGRPDEVELKYEELEAIRLADQERLKRIEAAARMGISRHSFDRVLKGARGAVANALISGKIIRVSGGVYRISGKPDKGHKRPEDQKAGKE